MAQLGVIVDMCDDFIFNLYHNYILNIFDENGLSHSPFSISRMLVVRLFCFVCLFVVCG